MRDRGSTTSGLAPPRSAERRIRVDPPVVISEARVGGGLVGVARGEQIQEVEPVPVDDSRLSFPMFSLAVTPPLAAPEFDQVPGDEDDVGCPWWRRRSMPRCWCSSCSSEPASRRLELPLIESPRTATCRSVRCPTGVPSFPGFTDEPDGESPTADGLRRSFERMQWLVLDTRISFRKYPLKRCNDELFSLRGGPG